LPRNWSGLVGPGPSRAYVPGTSNRPCSSGVIGPSIVPLAQSKSRLATLSVTCMLT